jgi:excisionase family DNA binding protein
MEKLLTVEQLGELIQISRRTIYEWSHSGFIPHYKLPKGVRFKASEVEKWLNSKKRKGRNQYKLNIEI